MGRNGRPLVLILIGSLFLLVVLPGADVSRGPLFTQAMVTPASEHEPTTWDYSVLSVDRIYGSQDGTTCVISICNLKSSGGRCEKIETTVDGSLNSSTEAARTEALARAIGRLGDEGWEMIGRGLDLGKEGEIKALHFKRPKYSRVTSP